MKINSDRLSEVVTELWADMEAGHIESIRVAVGGSDRVQIQIVVTSDEYEFLDRGSDYDCVEA